MTPEQIAANLACDVAAVRAVMAVESSGRGTLPDGRKKILFERHIMRRRLLVNGMTAQAVDQWSARRPDLVNSQPGGYVGGVSEYARLEAAATIDDRSARESASWGAFQILGMHWQAMGFASVYELTRADDGEMFVRFVKINPPLLRALRAHEWDRVARLFNGPNYRAGGYHLKLAAAFLDASEG